MHDESAIGYDQSQITNRLKWLGLSKWQYPRLLASVHRLKSEYVRIGWYSVIFSRFSGIILTPEIPILGGI